MTLRLLATGGTIAGLVGPPIGAFVAATRALAATV